MSLLKDREFQVLILLIIVTVLVGTVFYHNVEGWGWEDSIYFSVVTITTVGYGDLYPTTSLSKAFTIFYILVGLHLILSLVSPIAHKRFKKDIDKNLDKKVARRVKKDVKKKALKKSVKK